MVNILSVDLESWVHAHPELYNDLSSEEKRGKDQEYIVSATHSLLELLSTYDAKATFFIVSEIYEWYPELIECIRDNGHEIGFHTRSHKIVNCSGDIARELAQSETFIRIFEPKGFRAPLLCIQNDCFQILQEHGFEYDSSLYHTQPIKSFAYGIDEIPVSLFSYRKLNSSPIRLPHNLSMRLLTKGFPYGSGFFTPLGRLVDFCITQSNYNHLFIHPWQISRPKAYFMSKRFLARHPLWFLYSLNITKNLISMLKKHRFNSIAYHRSHSSIFS